MSSVRYADAEPSGLGSILGSLIEQNLAREPARDRLLKPALVSIDAVGADVGVTLRISAGSVVVSNGVSRDADILVIADPNRLLSITAAPLRLGFPDPLTADGRSVVAGIFRRDVRIRGMVRHPLKLRRLTALLSVA